MQWEYLVIEEASGDVRYTTDGGEETKLPLQDYLNWCGKNGWEVTAAIPRQDAHSFELSTIILKRPLD